MAEPGALLGVPVHPPLTRVHIQPHQGGRVGQERGPGGQLGQQPPADGLELAHVGPGHQVTGGGESAHVQADLGDDGLGALPADAGDLVQAIDGGQHRGVRAPAGAGAGGAVGVGALGGGDGCDQFLDAGGEPADLHVELVDLVQQHPGQLGVMVVETAGERFDQRGPLGLHPAAGQVGEHLRVPFPGDERLQHVPHRLGVQRGGHGRDLDQRVLQQLLQPLPVPGAFPRQVDAQPV